MLKLTKKQFIELMLLVEAMSEINGNIEDKLDELFSDKGCNILKSRCLENSLIEFIAENVEDVYKDKKGETISWYLYEACLFEEKDKYIEIDSKKYFVRNLEELYDFFEKTI